MSRLAFILSAVILLGLAGLPAAQAGQVRVTVQSNFFTPRAVNCNLGDHVVWVVISGTHTVTSGDSSTVTPDGRFDSGFFSSINFGAFTWKSNVSGTSLYYCQPHAPGMAGRVIVGTGIAVADFRFSEIDYKGTGGHDRIEIQNLGAASGNLGRYRIATQPAVSFTLPPTDIPVPAGGTVVLHVGVSGTNTATDVFLPSMPDQGNVGSLGLYAPSTVNTNLNDAAQIVDYVQWGAGGLANETPAVTAGCWTAGQFLAEMATGHSMELCSTARGAGAWAEVATPNFGSDANCSTPAGRDTWGRIKTLYR